jgi:DNA-binding GntR family transcriptional regulator
VVAQEPGIFTAQQLAYRHIRERILDGRFAGGALLKPQAIAEHLAISRIPVREAMQQLAAEGLIQLRLNRTAVVTILTIPEINDLFEMRAALEALTAEGIARHVDAAALDELEGLRARMDAARGDALQWLGRHGAFHDCLLGLCGRPRLAAEVVRLRTAIQPHLLFHIDIYRTTEMAGYEHETILAALRTGNAKVIEICLRDHVLSAARGVVQFLATHHPGLGETTGRAGEAAPARAVRGAAEARDAGSAAS